MQRLLDKFKRDRRLGVAENAGRYDLPLNQSVGTGFLILLVGLMTFLGMMAITANYALGGLTGRWTSGLEKVLTVEIPATKTDGKIRSDDEITSVKQSIATALRKNPNVIELKVLTDSQIADLVSPWLGEDASLDGIPLPGLISVELQIKDAAQIEKVRESVRTVSADAHLDTHEDWLDDILRLAGSLKFSAILITIVIGATTVVAIAGGIRSRMAEHQADIELLHLMGASDYYITRQFQRHALIMALKGSLGGVGAGLVVLGFMAMIGGGANGLIPSLTLSAAQIISLLSLPFIICIIAGITARFTVLRTLAGMP